MTIIVHTSVNTMLGQGMEALAPNGQDWIAVFSEGNFIRASSNSPLSQNSSVTDDTVVLSEAA